jgi:hypothetical protein
VSSADPTTQEPSVAVAAKRIRLFDFGSGVARTGCKLHAKRQGAPAGAWMVREPALDDVAPDGFPNDRESQIGAFGSWRYLSSRNSCRAAPCTCSYLKTVAAVSKRCNVGQAFCQLRKNLIENSTMSQRLVCWSGYQCPGVVAKLRCFRCVTRRLQKESRVTSGG